MRTRTSVVSIALLLIGVQCAMSQVGALEANKRLVRDFTDTLNAANWAALENVVAEDFTRHSAATAGPPVTSRDAFVELQKSFLTSFPDQRVTLEKLVAEGDYVAVLATYAGTQTGPMGDFPATGKKVEAPFLALFRIESNKIAEMWVEWDNIVMLRQLGLFPPPAPASVQPEPDNRSGENTMDETRLRQLGTRYAAAWSSQNPASLAAFYSEDGSLRVNDGEAAVGRAAITAKAQGFMEAFPDMLVKMDRIGREGDQVVFHWTWTGTNTGPGGTGKAVDLQGYEEWTLDANGLIIQSLGHYDEAEYRRQFDGDGGE